MSAKGIHEKLRPELSAKTKKEKNQIKLTTVFWLFGKYS